ncbi:MAG: hypothetical protein H0V07_14910 [Propionibacteriales bacterium]|nr:hypothetical protein [Propionibacteriales bacterium]
MVDASEVACAYARHNADNAAPAGRVSVLLGSLLEVMASQGEFAIILADPPWVPTAQVDRFPADPRSAIDGGEDGLDLVWDCLFVIGRHLQERGSAILQVGTLAQASAVRQRLDMRPELRLEVRQCRVHGNRGALVLLARPGAAPVVRDLPAGEIPG